MVTALRIPGLLSLDENIEQLTLMETGQLRMAHSTNLVHPVYVCVNMRSAESGNLSDVPQTCVKFLALRSALR